MKLSNAIKDVIGRFGSEVLLNRQFVNILSDVGGFKDEPGATKKVIKGLLESGFSEMLYDLLEKKESNWQNSVRKCVSDYAAKSGYKDELVNEIAAKLLYGGGVIDKLPKIESYRSQPSPSNPKEHLYALKQEYIVALSNLLTITTDELGLKYGYYTTEANTKLYVIEGKIRILANEVGESNIDTWLLSEKTKVETRNRPTQAQVQQALDNLMASLVTEYRAVMEKGYIVESDEFALKSAKFTPNAIAELQALGEKIISVGNKRNEDRQSWIRRTNSEFLESKGSPASTRKNVLNKLKKDYLSRLSELSGKTKSGGIDFSDETLKQMRLKLFKLGSVIGVNTEIWCDTENDKVVKERIDQLAKRKKKKKKIGIIAGILLFIGGCEGISYTTSRDAIAAYEQTMTSATAEYNQGSYVTALDLFQKAENDYNGSYSETTYKNEAHAKAVETTDKIITVWEQEVRTLLHSNKIAQAKILTLSLPSNLVLSENSEKIYTSITEQIDTDLARHTSAVVDKLLNDIYIHQCKLSEAGKIELEEMIQAVPDNYWLNFIKEKTK